MDTLPSFLRSKPLQKIFDLLGQDNVRVVGGAVRNYLLNVPVTDIDCATLWTPDELIQKGQNAGLKVIPTGIDHGTVTFLIEGQSFEVTTLRKDVETDGRRAVVAYSRSWSDDAQRRDFTINALYMDQEGKIYDPLGEGLSDIKKKKVKFVGNPATRLQEDALRILRFYRFCAYYGGEKIDREGLEACREHVTLLKTLSRERITEELFKMSTKEASLPLLKVMDENNVLSTISNFTCDINILERVLNSQKQHNLSCKLSLIFCLLGGKATACSLALSLSKKQINFIRKLEEACPFFDLPVEHLLYQYGRELGQQALLFQGRQEKDILFSKIWEIPVFPLTGQDLLEKGVPEGKDIGVRLKKVEKWWIERNFEPDTKECLSEAIGF